MTIDNKGILIYGFSGNLRLQWREDNKGRWTRSPWSCTRKMVRFKELKGDVWLYYHDFLTVEAAILLVADWWTTNWLKGQCQAPFRRDVVCRGIFFWRCSQGAYINQLLSLRSWWKPLAFHPPETVFTWGLMELIILSRQSVTVVCIFNIILIRQRLKLKCFNTKLTLGASRCKILQYMKKGQHFINSQLVLW